MFVRLSEALEDVVRKTEIEGGIEKGRVILLWPQAVGERIAARTRPYLFREGILFVAANSSVWAQELSLVKNSLIKKMNECLGKEVVRDIRFQARPAVVSADREA